MTNPAKPVISYSYTGFQLGQGNNAFPGTQLDSDIATLVAAADATIDGLADVRRSDGALQNAIVTPDSLAPAVYLGLQTPTVWAAGVNYASAATVTVSAAGYQGIYRCVVAHLSGAFATDFANGKWALVFSFIAVSVASSVAFTPAGNIAATNVQTALIELDTEKEPAVVVGTAAQFWRGDKVFTDFATTVRASVLTGISFATSTAVVAADTLLAAAGKLQAQVSLKANSAAPTFTGVVGVPTPAAADNTATAATTAWVRGAYGTVTITPGGTMTAVASPSNPRAVKAGNVVQCKGWFTKTAGTIIASGVAIGTVPAGYRPLGSIIGIIVLTDGSANYEVVPVGVDPTTGVITTSRASTGFGYLVSLDSLVWDISF